MNASANPEGEHQVYLCLGSNIDPVENISKAVNLLRERTHLLALSAVWETEALSASGRDSAADRWPNFLNLAAFVITPLDPAALKARILKPIEQQLGRVRKADKYAPRTIDLDITLYDQEQLDPEIWQRVYLAVTFAELLPDLKNPETGETLKAAAERLQQGWLAVRHPELHF